MPILVGTTTDPTGINDLVVDGTTYDVTLSTTTLNSFTRGSTLSTDAASALTSALNALSVTELGNVGPEAAFIGYLADVDNSLTLFDGPACDGNCVTWFQTTISASFTTLGSNNDQFLEAADFAPVSSVPEPLIIGLFGTGLVALFMLRRRSANS